MPTPAPTSSTTPPEGGESAAEPRLEAPTSPRATTRRAEPHPAPPPVAASVTVRPWADPVIDTVGHDPRSVYVERFWLSVLGPSTVLLFRRIALLFDLAPDGFSLDLGQTAAALGLSSRVPREGNKSPIVRSLHRACTFGVARADEDDLFLVRRRFPPLTRRQLGHLPEELQREHRQWVERDARRPVAAETRHRARRLALSLIELGETYDAAERQLHRWKFHPAVAYDAVKWAHAERHATARRDATDEVHAGPALSGE